MAKAKEPVRFGAAMQELEEILRRVEGEEIDIDELADELQRAAELLEICRAKIRRAEVEVSQIVQSLEEPAADEDEQAEASEERGGAVDPDAGGTANLFDGGE